MKTVKERNRSGEAREIGGLTPDRMIARVFRTDSKFFRKGGKSKANPQGNYGEENA